MSSIGVVVIGRNEGDRLHSCLGSVGVARARVVYVDSDSADGSVALARAMGVEAFELDPSAPLNAARARNAGYRRLRESQSGVRFVQFLDADCEMVGDWLRTAATTLLARAEVAVVAGWLRERSPQASIYNRIGDVEWNFAGAGEVDSVGGIFMIRCEAFNEAGGFDPTVPAGEEPELCQRLTRQGWRILRLEQNMALHDLGMTRFVQWWRRMVRSGYGGMDVAWRFRIAKFVRSSWRARIWAGWLVLTLGIGVGAVAGSGTCAALAAVLVGGWSAQVLRVALRTRRKGYPFATSAAYAGLVMISFLPQIVGQAMYFSDRLRKRAARLVEYKSPRPPGGGRRG